MAAGVALAYNDKQGATLVVAIDQFVVVALGALGAEHREMNRVHQY